MTGRGEGPNDGAGGWVPMTGRGVGPNDGAGGGSQ
jgi:hypothetical protein